MSKKPFEADNPEQAMRNFNEALRKVLSVSKEDVRKDYPVQYLNPEVGRKHRAKKKVNKIKSA